MEVCNIMYEKNIQSVVYVSFPQINDLCCAICEIDFIEVHDSSAKSNFHWQIMKCRLLIHLISDIIAAPVLGTERFMFVIVHKRFFEIGKLESVLRNFKLVYRGLRSITIELYKSCLIYTLQTKIAPLWNKVGDYFIQGKIFYDSIEGHRALKIDIFMEENNICLQLNAEKVKISYIRLEDYLPSTVIAHFLADPKGYIDLSHCNLPFVYVLPSMKRGKLLSVSKELPVQCVFKDHDQLRRHWKNMYGYSLPKNKDSILYYEIKFLIPKSKIFVYPNVCVASGPLEIIPSEDKKPTITYFLSDMFVKLPTVCGKQLQISKHTPFNIKSLNTILSPNMLLKSKGESICLEEKDNTNSQLEFSSTYTPELRKDTNTATLLKTQLTKIHQIHNVPLQENIRNIREKQNEIQYLNTIKNSSTQHMKNNFIKNNVSRNLHSNFIESKKGAISKYFKIQKTSFHGNTVKLMQGDKQKDLTLKEKLSKARSSKDSSTFSPQRDQDITVETMAKKNQLDQMKNSELSDWLQRHSIPHKSKVKKAELVNKVLSHMRNTQILQQFRI